MGLRVLANLGIFQEIYLGISLENAASRLERDIHEILMDIPETLRNIHLSSQLAPFSRDIPRNIPRNIARLARALRTLLRQACSTALSNMLVYRPIIYLCSP